MTVSEPATALDRPDPPAAAQRLPGDLDMWVMVLGDLFFFGSYFIVYMVFRDRSLEQFTDAQRHLSMGIGITNTLVLLTSSMFIASAVQAVRHGAPKTAERLVYAAGACGVIFILLKAFEWHREISLGYTLGNEFFSFYFVLTGIHVAHLVLGLLILGIVVRELRNPAGQRSSLVEQGATYWHMIDLLWVVIFAVLYCMR
ncbi:cytochrome c oxidase subunit 3 [Nocardia aurantia]|uniref:Cytochrome aa3 subunit 3 n=1 Tax=Nocardia aurantia TaxID=2585199 RepID=A0A7K0E1E7_9NOCA|nr:cytochrome c oxidase subunit 3 [Nocardia aurantia]MQY31916.1 Cytochrome c oxidase subunit 3 [Nocardia aurantia]